MVTEREENKTPQNQIYLLKSILIFRQQRNISLLPNGAADRQCGKYSIKGRLLGDIRHSVEWSFVAHFDTFLMCRRCMEMTAHALADNQRDYERKSHSLEWISYREIDSYGLLLHPMPVRRWPHIHCAIDWYALSSIRCDELPTFRASNIRKKLNS